MKWLILRLEAPLMSFGGATIDAYGISRDFPAQSALTGLLANALGIERRQTGRLDNLQRRLVFAAALEQLSQPSRLRDFQTAKLEAADRGWTTCNGPEGRAGGAGTYNSPHIRYRDYLADACVTVVVRLEPSSDSGAPTLDDVARAFDRPARPLFIGRKHALPSGRMNAGFIEGDRALAVLEAALAAMPEIGQAGEVIRMIWPADHDLDRADNVIDLCDQRNWATGLHGGSRRVAEGRLVRGGAPT
nr:type I-E CRISPR-associated protein Cas5/CasD [uncultured Cohaesibacter sp.]